MSSYGKPKTGETALEIRDRGWVVHSTVPDHATVAGHRPPARDGFTMLGIFEWPKFDHRHLLSQYMAHVGMHEGVDFVQGEPRSDLFTVAEWQEMQRIARESIG